MKGFENLDFDNALLLTIVGLAFSAVLTFVVGWPIGVWQFWVVIFSVAIGMFVSSRRNGMLFLFAIGFSALATAFTFSYFGTDALACWAPMQRMIQNDWNPICQYDLESISAQLDGMSAAMDHMLIYPKFLPYVAGVVGKGLGLFVADAFLAYLLMIVLWRRAAAFAVDNWCVSSFSAHAFAAGVTTTTKIVSVLAGHMDYDVYAAFLIALFSLDAFGKTRSRRFLLQFALAELILLGLKANAQIDAIMLMLFGIVCVRSDLRRQFAVCCGGVILLAVVENLNPILPILNRFVLEGQPWRDVTSDFVGNADAERLGYFWRIVYAWFSSDMAPGRPEFYVCGGVGGFGFPFRVLIWCSVLALLCSRWTCVSWCVLVIFVTSNILPLKYIGHARYCPQIWVIPFLAAYNLGYAPRNFFLRMRRCAVLLRNAAVTGTLFAALALFARVCLKQVEFAKAESARVKVIDRMRAIGGVYCVRETGRNAYCIRERLRYSGVVVCSSSNAVSSAGIVSYFEQSGVLNVDFHTLDGNRE